MPIIVEALKDVVLDGQKLKAGQQTQSQPDVARAYVLREELKVVGPAEDTVRDMAGAGTNPPTPPAKPTSTPSTPRTPQPATPAVPATPATPPARTTSSTARTAATARTTSARGARSDDRRGTFGSKR